jgi:hypothetical protein
MFQLHIVNGIVVMNQKTEEDQIDSEHFCSASGNDIAGDICTLHKDKT